MFQQSFFLFFMLSGFFISCSYNSHRKKYFLILPELTPEMRNSTERS